MSALRSIAIDARHRARRWDAIVLGSGVPALLAAARIGLPGHRVLVVAEQAAANLAPPLREPFFYAGARGGVLEAALRELKLPLIDRRRFQPEDIAYQVIGPDLRLDVGPLARSADELVAWGLEKPGPAHAMVGGLAAAAEIERQHLLAAPVVRAGGGLRALARGASAAASAVPAGARGLPAEVANAPAKLGRLFAAQVRALANHASGGPSSEACARLLGDAQGGGAAVEPGVPGLLDVLRRRVESLYGELRSVRSGAFELVNAGGVPGLLLGESSEVWLGKALVVAASPSALAASMAAESRRGGEPDASAVDAIARALGARAAGAARRLLFHFRAPRALLPEGMAARLVLLTLPDAKDPQDGVASVALHAAGPRSEIVDLVVRTFACAGESASDAASRVEAALRELMPFAAAQLERVRIERPSWDDDDWLEDAPAGSNWPGEAELRVSNRPAVYRLDRPAVAGLGLEGDLLLGWRSGDAIAAELA